MTSNPKHMELINEFLSKKLGEEYQIRSIAFEQTVYEIDVTKVGVLAPMFHSITLKIGVVYFEDEDVTKLVLKYSYRHLGGGSNGYTVDYYVTEKHGVETWSELCNRERELHIKQGDDK